MILLALFLIYIIYYLIQWWTRIFFLGGAHYRLRLKYLKTAQFTNLYARKMGGAWAPLSLGT